MEETKQETRIAIYKWIKIIQSILLLVLGFAMITIALVRKDKDAGTTKEAISYCIGTALSLYGVINMLSGYLLNRSPVCREVIMGLAIASFGICFLVENEILTALFPFLIIILFYGFSVLLIVYGIDKIIGKEVKKNLIFGVVLFILAAALIALATLYIFYKDNEKLLNYVLIGIGILLAILGITSFVLLLIKLHNTKLAEKEQKIKEEQQLADREEIEKRETRIIDISELRKKNGKKINNKQIANQATENNASKQTNSIPAIFLDKENKEDAKTDTTTDKENTPATTNTTDDTPIVVTDKKTKNRNDI